MIRRDAQPTPTGDYRLTLADGTELAMSRRYRGRLLGAERRTV